MLNMISLILGTIALILAIANFAWMLYNEKIEREAEELARAVNDVFSFKFPDIPFDSILKVDEEENKMVVEWEDETC